MLRWTDGDGRGCDAHFMGTRFLVENRLLVPCHDGYAALDPARGIAGHTWRFAPIYPKAFAFGPDGQWGVAFIHERALYLALANRDGWTVPPQYLVALNQWLRPAPLAMRWRDGGVDLVIQRVDTADTLGDRNAPELVRLQPGGMQRRLIPFACDHCFVEGVRETADGYEVVLEDALARTYPVVDKPNVLPAPVGGRRYEHVNGKLRASDDNHRVPRAGGGAYIVQDDGAYITVDAAGHRIDRLSLRAHLGPRIGGLMYALCGFPFAVALGLICALVVRAPRLRMVAIACGIYAVTAALALRTIFPLL
jgi:hypothetical protein